MDTFKITAVVVTFNRLSCIKKVVSCLLSQTYFLQQIIIIDNGSTDGTREWLDKQTNLHVIHQDNVGGSGGFYRGIQEALNFENDWIWCMDDDVYPRKDCLENLLKSNGANVGILCPRRIQNGKIIYSECKKMNLSNPFKKLHLQVLSDDDISQNNPVAIEGMAFEGPLVKRQVVETIGLPQKDLFIFYDDTDYSYRTVLAGFKVLYVPLSVMDKEFFEKNVSKETFINKQRWKLWYHIRNTSYFVKKYGKNSFYRIFGEFNLPIYMLCAISFNLLLNHKYEWSDLKKVIYAFRLGKMGKLGTISF